MGDGRKIEISLPSVLGSEKIAMARAASVAKEMGFSEDRIEDLKTALSEACVNAIEHGNQLDAGSQVEITLTPGDAKLEISVRDKGRGIEEVTKPDIDDKIEGKGKTRGWGIFLIKSLMNEVKFEAAPEGGNVVTMIIRMEK